MHLLSSVKQSLPSLKDPIQRLCSMKNNLQFTPHQLETWIAALSVFDPADVTRACLEIGLSEDPFPDLGKLIAKCQGFRRARSNEVFRDEKRVSSTLVEKIAEAMELNIKPGRSAAR